ncbi:class I SAM-dependent methyltransferase [Stieleria sp. TO1_6]|uniref:class I SAM-dependent methyltransferase n=1 Tax=Stieleria tagensis TaxID=2956795 RepID=UPI00209AABA7|nr:class I SAM-dependent methyltransferase [Stieleria tagensis]MCO8123442.1 class I SAM-dependent methyltransferase [Stieleria tagensis]
MSQFSSGKRVLDVPCGMGWGTSLIKNTEKLIGIDIAEDAISEANARYGNVASFEVGSMDDLGFGDETFDVVACLEGIEHVDISIGKKFLQESFRVLAKNGLLLISSPHTESGEHSGNPFHVHEYSKDELADMLEKHFSIDSVSHRKVDNLVVDYFVCRKAATS